MDENGVPLEFPNLAKIRRKLPTEKLEDLDTSLSNELAESRVTIKPGSRIAIAAGSRGIANIARIIKCIVDWVRSEGGVPFIVPAMGSHGGGVAEAQKQILESYGISEDGVGAQIRSSMEVVELPADDLPFPVFFDKYAFESDGVIVVNRIKVHTDFHGRYESGLMKMLAIGLGKHRQALAIHSYGVFGMRELLPKVARQMLTHANVLMGIGIVENAREETLAIRAMPAASIPDVEPELLEIARSTMPRLPVDELDVLIVDEVGKNISGAGLDTNIIGRLRIPGEQEPESPKIKVIFIRDLTPESHGNAVGMGLADVMTRRFFDKVDLSATYENAATSTFLERAKAPLIAENDRDGLRIGIRPCGPVSADGLRVIRIRSTLHLEDMYVSPAVMEEINSSQEVEVISSAAEPFNGSNDLRPF